jgi:hypothetical protein
MQNTGECMVTEKICSNCNRKIPSDADYCPICGFRLTNRPFSEEFIKWDEEEESKNYKTFYNPPSATQEICKCIGKIDGILCNTYYYVSSIKNHGGCARRDCSNSFENNPKVTIDWGDEIYREYKDSHPGLNILVGLIGVVALVLGIAYGSIVLILGLFFILLAFMIPYEKKGRRKEKVTFKLVNKFEVPRNAKDPWTQKKILESSKSKSEESEYVRW